MENAIAQLKSFYTLELFILPGGSRKAHLYAFGSIAEVQRALKVEFSHAFELYTLLVYGEDVYLSIYQGGEMVNQINLLPYITVNIPGEGTFVIVDILPDVNVQGCPNLTI
jgi:hypothetical protein